MLTHRGTHWNASLYEPSRQGWLINYWFKTLQSVRQGRSMLHTLFNIYIDDVVRT